MKTISKRSKSRKKNKKRNVEKIIEKRFNILIILIIVIMFILMIGLFYYQVIKHNVYKDKLKDLTETIIMGDSAPRGRIYDRNHVLIVDNKPIKIIYYKTPLGITVKEEIENAYKVASIIDIDYSNLYDYDLKDFWTKKFPTEANNKITDEEWKQYENRKLSLDEIESFKRDRITEEDLNKFSLLDYKAAYIYYLMNKGYYYDEKIIKNENVTDEEYAYISEKINTLKGFNTKLDWERQYLYGNTFKTILGNVSTIPAEKKAEYMENGYVLNDRVGTTYLEYQYENYLKGEKNKYLLKDDGTKKLIEEGSRGNDIVLTIDIKLQQEVEKILEDQLRNAKKEPNTEYYNRSFVVITDPNNGEILAMAGKQIVKVGSGYEIYDYTPGVTTSPVVVGSVVKGASNIVGYNTGALKIGENRNDFCIKIEATPEKCSWTKLGRLNDVTALKYSSNSFQYQTAIKVGGGNYKYNKPLNLNEQAFETYRNIFKEFGLGTKTGIDLPIESIGYIGSNTMPGYLLDFAIGQYDTYTPVQLAQYVSTIANGGNRYQLHLLKEVYSSSSASFDKLIYKFEPQILNKVNTEDKYLDRVKEGFKEVLKSDGTGYGYMPNNIKPAGKTGTSQSFADSNQDGIIDTETLTNTFIGYAPYDNPVFSYAVLSPDVTHYGNNSTYRTSVNKKISYEVAKKFFEIYK